MKTVGIFTNPIKDVDGQYSINLKSSLEKAGFSVVQISEVEQSACIPDVLLVLGGDGTILKIAAYAAENNVPIIGINLGQLGFLTEFEPLHEDEIIAALKEDAFVQDERSLLEVSLNEKRFLALNDVVIHRLTVKECDRQVVKLRAFADGELLDSFVSDGLIITTPTGSTAYFLSAGGNILAPDISATAIAPICAHSLHSRPVILPDTKTITVEPDNDVLSGVFCDGKEVFRIQAGDSLRVTTYSKKLRFLRSPSWNFYAVLLQKLNHWSRG